MKPSERRLLVIGSGFIGTEVALTARHSWEWDVKIIYRNHVNSRTNSIGSTLLPHDVDGLKDLFDQIEPTDVLMALGSSYVPEINSNLDAAISQHLDSSLMIFDAMARMKKRLAGNVIVIGSASEYGDFGTGPVDENRESRPRDSYGLIKLALRHLGLHYVKNYGLPIVHVRQFNVTGMRQDPRFVVPSICRQIAKLTGVKSQKIVAGNTEVQRDFLAINDVCEAYRTLFLTGQPGEIYNVCSGAAWRIRDIINLAAELQGTEVEIEINESLLRVNDKVQSIICGNPSKLIGLGWKPQIDMQTLLREFLDFYLSENQTNRQTQEIKVSLNVPNTKS